MKAIVIRSYGEADVLRLSVSEPKPRPGAGQALIRIHAAGINFVDIYQRRGAYPVALPFIPGLEASGVVEEAGENAAEVRPGDRVAYTGHLGSYSEYTAIEAGKLIALPADMSFEQAAAFPLQGMTAHYLIHEFRRPGPGDTVLVHAAAGGVGRLLVQWAKHLGAMVIGTVSTEEKARLARDAGADEVILYTQQDFLTEVKRITDGKGVQVVYDSVGKDTFDKSLDSLAPLGYMVSFGQSSGFAPLFDIQRLAGMRSLFLTRPSLFAYIRERTDYLHHANAVVGMILAGQLRLRIGATYPLAEAAAAHEALAGRQTTGKVLLIP